MTCILVGVILEVHIADIYIFTHKLIDFNINHNHKLITIAYDLGWADLFQFNELDQFNLTLIG